MQFISTGIAWTRVFLDDPDNNRYKDRYYLDMELSQSLNDGVDIIELDEKGNIKNSRLKVAMVMYNDDNDEPYRYAFGELVSRDTSGKYHVQFSFATTDQINDDNKIRVEDVYIPNSDAKEYGYFTNHMTVKLYVLAKSRNGED